MEFLKEALSMAVFLLMIYGGLLGGLVAVVTIGLVGVGSWKGLKWLGIPTLISRAWAATVVRLWATMIVVLDRAVRWFLPRAKRALKTAADIAFNILMYLILSLGPWVLFFVVCKSTSLRPAAYGLGAVFISLPVCLISWPIILRLDKQRANLSQLPKVLAIAVLWVAPVLAVFPIVMTSD